MAYIAAQSAPDLLRTDVEHPLWWAVERAMFATGETDGEDLWRFILCVLEKEPPDNVLGVLAAGPLEELIAYAGHEYIERIEAEARINPRFRQLLGGVWQHGTPEDIWSRVEAASGAAW
jgi:hypothetical protein